MDQTAESKPTTDLRVAQSHLHRRRTLIVRRAVMLGVMGLLICIVAVWLRNQAYVRQNIVRFQEATAGLVSTFRDTDMLPTSYPPLDSSGLPKSLDGVHYQDGAVIRYLRQSPDGGVVAYSDGVRQILRVDVIIILMLRSGQLTVETMTNPQFYRHQQALRRQAETAVTSASPAQSPP